AATMGIPPPPGRAAMASQAPQLARDGLGLGRGRVERTALLPGRPRLRGLAILLVARPQGRENRGNNGPGKGPPPSPRPARPPGGGDFCLWPAPGAGRPRASRPPERPPPWRPAS